VWFLRSLCLTDTIMSDGGIMLRLLISICGVILLAGRLTAATYHVDAETGADASSRPTHRRALGGCLWPHVGWIGLHAAAPFADERLSPSARERVPRPRSHQIKQAMTTPEVDTSGVVSSLGFGGSGASAMVDLFGRPSRRLRGMLGIRRLAAASRLATGGAARPGRGQTWLGLGPAWPASDPIARERRSSVRSRGL
jgi:hypothetical protein